MRRVNDAASCGSSSEGGRMPTVVTILLYTSRFLATCSILAGLAVGFFAAAAASFICFDSCPAPEDYLPNQISFTALMMLPCVVLTVLALVTFVAYCLATRQLRRAARQTLVLLVGGLIGGVALSAFLRQGQANLPRASYGGFVEGPLETWQRLWGLALMVVAGAWSIILAYLQWAA